MNLNDFRRLIEPLKRRIFLLLGRAILTAIDNAGNTQKMQITVLSNETISDVERFQEYGLETYPFTDAEPLAVFLNGNRDHGIVLCVHDRRYRPKDLVEGEAALYTDEDQLTGGCRVHLKRGQIIDVKGKELNLMMIDKQTEVMKEKNINATIKIEEITPRKTVTASTEFKVDSPQVALSSAWGALRSFIDERFIALFNVHVHSGVTAGGANTAVPTVLMDLVNHATSKVKGE